MKDRLLRWWLLPTGPWLTVGVIVAGLSAAIPFGVSDTTSGVGPNTFEWVETVLFFSLTVAFMLTFHRPKVRSWVASISGGLWFGVAVGNMVANYEVLDRPTLIAYTLLPLGLSFCSFALARVAELEKQVAVGSDQ